MTMTARWGLLDETPVSIILRKPEVLRAASPLRLLGIIENGSIWNPLTKTGNGSTSGGVA